MIGLYVCNSYTSDRTSWASDIYTCLVSSPSLVSLAMPQTLLFLVWETLKSIYALDLALVGCPLPSHSLVHIASQRYIPTIFEVLPQTKAK